MNRYNSFLPRMACFRKRFWVFVLVYLCSLVGLQPFCNAQNEERIDSLKSLLNAKVPDSTKINIWVQLAFEYVNVDSAKTFEYGMQAINLAETIAYPKGKASAMIHLGWAVLRKGHYKEAHDQFQLAYSIAKKQEYWSCMGDALHGLSTVEGEGNQDYEKAYEYITRALELHDKADNLEGKALCYNQRAIIFFYRGKIYHALEDFIAALKIREKLQQPEKQSSLIQNIATLYKNIGDDHKVLPYYHKAIQLDKRYGNTRSLGITYSNMAEIYVDMQAYDSAKWYSNQALTLFKSLDYPLGLAGVYISLGDAYLHEDSLQKAENSLKEALAIKQRVQGTGSTGYILHNLAEVYLKKGDIEQAYRYAVQSQQLAEENQNVQNLFDALEILSRVQLAQQNYREAYQLRDRYEALEDSMSNRENLQEIARIEAEYTFYKEKDSLAFAQEKVRMAYEMEIEERKRKQWFIGVALVISLLMLGVIYRQNRQQLMANTNLVQLNAEIKSQRDEILQQADTLAEQAQQLEKQNIRLLELNEEKNLLVGVVAHDLKSPLSQIKGLLTIIESTEKSLLEETKTCIQMMKDSVARQQNLIGRILDVTAIDKERLALQMQPVSFPTLLAETAQTFANVAEKKEIQLIDTGIAPLSAKVEVDPAYLRQVFENLFSNAIKFSPLQKTVWYGVDQSQGSWRAYIRDEGPGIHEADLKKLFVKFEKLAAKPTAGESSTGLGLAIVKKYIDAMDGRIWCESQVGEGATFWVEFAKA